MNKMIAASLLISVFGTAALQAAPVAIEQLGAGSGAQAVQQPTPVAEKYLPAGKAGSSEGIEMTGFTIVKDNSSLMQLKFREETSVFISKARFKDKKSAEKFCKGVGSALDKDFMMPMLLAMSGAGEFSPFIKEALSFSFKGPNTDGTLSGVWAWAGAGEAVTMVLDGQGSDPQDMPLAKLNEVLSQALQKPGYKAALPAICATNLK
jgi:hypothetical protein